MPFNPYTATQKKNSTNYMNCAKTAGMGFGLGAGIGVTVGVLFGGLNAMTNPKIAGRRVRYIASTCTQTGGMFGIFVAAGFLMRGC
mmetsp:Transcript_9859/g.13729  ORF Transcript_9859/g.13729 Transcript_9859/m.13729 type:complete len:86 (-) Transcript_9859:306-563(-)